MKYWFPTQVHHVHENLEVEFLVIFQPKFEPSRRWVVRLAVMAELLDLSKQLFIHVIVTRMFEQSCQPLNGWMPEPPV
jgi:hypothetical protein